MTQYKIKGQSMKARKRKNHALIKEVSIHAVIDISEVRQARKASFDLLMRVNNQSWIRCKRGQWLLTGVNAAERADGTCWDFTYTFLKDPQNKHWYHYGDFKLLRLKDNASYRKIIRTELTGQRFTRQQAREAVDLASLKIKG